MEEPAPFCRDDLERRGFQGFLTFAALNRIGLSVIPSTPGCYAVLHTAGGSPAFLERSPAGWFKGKDPTISISDLQSAWLADCETIYIGQSGDLRRRWQTRMKFGAGAAVGAWGGRAIWQLRDSDDFVLAWKAEEHPKVTEKQLLEEFRSVYGRRPFANRR
jgi:hypothetical protein